MTKTYRVALIGLDGCGKSTQIDKMKKDKLFSKYKFIWCRWKPTLLKPIYLLLSKKIKNSDNRPIDLNKDKLNHDYRAKAVIKNKLFSNKLIRISWIKLALIDYYFQFYLKILILIIQKRNIVFDRYYLDLFVDQGINFGYTPKQICDEIEKYKNLFPKIDKVIYIKVRPEVCFMRKNDIPNMDYLNKRHEIYEYLSKDLKWICIDGENELESVYSEIKKTIVNSNIIKKS